MSNDTSSKKTNEESLEEFLQKENGETPQTEEETPQSLDQLLSGNNKDINNNNDDSVQPINEGVINPALQSNMRKKPKTQEDFQKEKAKNFLKIGLFVLAFLLFILFITIIIATISRQNSLKDREVIDETLKTVEINNNPTDFWKRKMEVNIQSVSDDNKEFQENIEKTINESIEQNALVLGESINYLNNKVEQSNETMLLQVEKIGKSVESLTTQILQDKTTADTELVKIREEIKNAKEAKVNIQLPPIVKTNTVPALPKTKIVTEQYEEDFSVSEEELKKLQKEKDDENSKIKLPSGFVQVITYTGIKGPTGSKGVSEPAPVRMEILGDLQHANGDTTKLDGCYLKGTAKGDITSLRNFTTVATLYCTGNDTKGKYFIEEKIDGQVHDELDGALGFPGVLVDSAGKILTREMSLAVVQGAATMFNNTENIIIPSGDTFSSSNTSMANEFTNGMGGAVGKGLEGTLQYWRKILEDYYPYIDSKAARVGKAYLEFNSKEFTKKYYKDFELDMNKEITNKDEWKQIIK